MVEHIRQPFGLGPQTHQLRLNIIKMLGIVVYAGDINVDPGG